MLDFFTARAGQQQQQDHQQLQVHTATARKASTAQRQKQQGSQKQQDANSGDRQERWNTKKSLISELGTAWAVR
jgi:hypothetical protein